MIKKIKSLTHHQGFMKYFKNTSWLFAEKILRMVVGLFVGIWVARYLGPEQFGLFSYALSFVGLFTAIATLGLDGIVVRELVKDEGKRDELIGTAFWLKVFGAIGVLFILTIAVNFTSNDNYTNTLVFIIASSTIFQSFNVIDFYFQSKVMSKYVVYANIISLFINSVVKIILIINEAPLIAFAWVVLFDSFMLAIGFIYFYTVNNLTLKLTFDKSIASNLLRDSWPLIISSISVGIYMKMDQIMLKEMLDSKSVGVYSAASRLSEALYFIPLVIGQSLLPKLVEIFKENKEKYYHRLQSFFSHMVLFGIILSIPVYLLSSQIILTLYGVEYTQAIGVLEIHIFTIVTISLAVAVGKWFIVENHTQFHMYMTFLTIILNFVFNYIFIPLYGAEGAALGTLLTRVIGTFFIGFISMTILKMSIMSFTLKGILWK